VSRLGDAYKAFTGQKRALTDLEGLGYQRRPAQSRTPVINDTTANRNSVWWACGHLRANVFSSFPLDVMKPGPDGLTYPVKNPGVLVDEPFPGIDITEFFYNTEMDLFRFGNSVGIIRSRNAFNLPVSVELQPMSICSAIMNGSKVTAWRIGRDVYAPSDIWHRRRNTRSGMALGMSALAAAAWDLGLHASATEFALDWFATGANPKGSLQHMNRETIPAAERQAVKDEFRQSTAGGDIFVHGKVWEWTPQQQDSAGAGFLETQSASERAIARYADVPASMVDVEITTGNITYANVTQANLQWLITSIGPEARRTERFWTRYALPKPWQLKLNTDALLRMDPATRADLMIKLKTAGLRVPSELRALDNLPPFTPEQLAELDQHADLAGKSSGAPKSSPAPAPVPA
jgi:HK97 family phage portal protein